MNWKKLYFNTVKILLGRSGGSAAGHHTIPIRKIIKKLSFKYDRKIIEEGIKRLIKKGDLILWPIGAKQIEENLSVSMNLARLRALEKYLKGHPEEYQRLKDIEKEIGYKED